MKFLVASLLRKMHIPISHILQWALPRLSFATIFPERPNIKCKATHVEWLTYCTTCRSWSMGDAVFETPEIAIDHLQRSEAIWVISSICFRVPAPVRTQIQKHTHTTKGCIQVIRTGASIGNKIHSSSSEHFITPPKENTTNIIDTPQLSALSWWTSIDQQRARHCIYAVKQKHSHRHQQETLFSFSIAHSTKEIFS